MYQGKTKVQFQINSYLRLADLCGPDEQEKKIAYMERTESLLMEMTAESDSICLSHPHSVKSSIHSFLEEIGTDDLNGQITLQVYRAYKEYCIVNNLSPVSKIEFSRQICGIKNLKTKDIRVAGIKMKMFIPANEE